MSDTHTYVGPGANILPAIQYLRKNGAISEEKAISLEEIKSEDFKQLLKLNGQTSMWIGVTPEGKYWVRSSFIIVMVMVFSVFLIFIFFVAFFMLKNFSSVFDNAQKQIQKVQEIQDEQLGISK